MPTHVQILVISPALLGGMFVFHLLESLYRAEGARKTLYGVPEEKKDYIMIITCWANLQSQHTWCLTYCYNHQTHLPADVVVAYGLMETFDAPITELVTWYYPLALLNQEFEAILIQTFSNFALGLSGSTPGHAGGSACGWSLAPVNFQGHLCKAFTGFIGWQSVGAHLQHTEDPAFQIGIRCLQLEGCVGVFVRHIPLRARLDRIL